jgi:repressor LexA
MSEQNENIQQAATKPADRTVRPTKKQRELLNYIEGFINEHGYSPSYREIMAGCDYTSVATVSLHVNNLIKRGHIIKRDHSARSLEVVSPSDKPVATNQVKPDEEKWLINKIDHYFTQSEQAGQLEQAQLNALQTLVNALGVLGIDGAVQSFTARLTTLKERLSKEGA